MVNSYNFSLTRNGTKDKFKYQAVVFENDLDNLFCKVLPRIPNNCRYIITKRPEEIKGNLEEFRVRIPIIKEILKFYLSTNYEYYKLQNNGELIINFEEFEKHVDNDGYFEVPVQIMDEEQLEIDNEKKRLKKGEVGDWIDDL